MAQIILGPNLSPNLDGSVKKAAYAFLEKLGKDDTAPGLHIEPIGEAADPRVRTGRVNDMWRALLVKITGANSGTHYVYLGTFPHDDAIARAKTTVIAINPRNGIAELIEADTEGALAEETPTSTVPAPGVPGKPKPDDVDTTAYPLLETQGISRADLLGLGIAPQLATRALLATDEDALLAALDPAPAAWQADAIIDLAAGTGLDAVVEKLELALRPPSAAQPSTPPDIDDELIDALRQPAAQMDFAFIEDDDALRAAIEDEDFGHWRVFLHPEQRKYAFQSRNGSFRLTGGAGTGKTVVLIHRARHLARQNPEARIILTTYNRTLAAALRDTLTLLDPHAPLLSDQDLGEPGIYIAPIDALARRILVSAEGHLGTHDGEPGPLARVLGPRSQHVRDLPARNAWGAALGASRGDLLNELATEGFLAAEYATVVVPNLITQRDEYLRVPRPGRGVRLNRAQRIAIWAVIEQYRQTSSAQGTTDFDEKAMIAAVHLDDVAAHGGARIADHVLVDEAQDLAPTRFRFLRALVATGANDLFLAEDSQQRIYGQKIVLSRYGINIRGRSRRLTLNYRTTAQNLGYAVGILTGVAWTDLDDDDVTSAGYRSARRGPTPRLVGCASLGAAYDKLADTVKGWMVSTKDAPTPETIGILALTNLQGETLVRALEERDVTARFVADDKPIDAGKVVVMTMHRSKGMEFRNVVLFGVSNDAGYWTAVAKNLPEAERVDADLKSRSLLYVAATRARDELVVLWSGEPSPLLPIK